MTVPRAGLAVAADSGTFSVVAATRGRAVVFGDGRTHDVGGRVELPFPARALAADPRRGLVLAAGGASAYRPPPGSLWAIDAATRDLVWEAPVGRTPVAIAVDSRRGLVYVANFRSGSVSVVSGEHGHPVRSVGLDGHPVNLTVQARTGHVYVTTEEGRLYLLARGGGPLKHRRAVSATNWPDVVADPRRDALYVTEPSRNRVVILDSKTLRRTGEIDFGDREPWDLALNGPRDRLFVRTDPGFRTDEAGGVEIVDLASRAVVDRVDTGAGGTDIAVDPAHWRVYVLDSFSGSAVVVTEDAEGPDVALEGGLVSVNTTRLRGTVTDDLSGVRRVVVRYLGATSETTAVARLRCEGRRTTCAWSAPAPRGPGLYRVTLKAVDRAGSLSTKAAGGAILSTG